MFVFCLLWLCSTLTLPLHATRSLLRPSYEKLPTLTVSYANTPAQTFTVRDSHLEWYPIFDTFDEEFCKAHSLPKGPIAHRYDATKSTSGNALSDDINGLLEEIENGIEEHENFTILKKRDFTCLQIRTQDT